MNLNEWKSNLTAYLKNRQVMTAVIVSLLAFVIASLVLFKKPVPGVIDFGEYTQTLSDLGLSYTERDLEKPQELTFVKVIQEYETGDLKPLSLLQVTPAQSLIYPVSLITIICRLTGILFDTRFLAAFLSIAAVCCIYSITKSLYVYMKESAAAAGLLLTAYVFCGSNSIYFNSLYGNGIFLIGLLLYFAVLLKLVSFGGKKGISGIIMLCFASLILLNSRETAVFMLPVVAVTDVIMIFYCRPEKGKRVLHATAGLLLLLFVVRANIGYAVNSPSFYSDTRLYHSFFTGVLEYSSEPEKILDELLMDQDFTADIGKNAYLSESDYVVAPGSKEASDAIFSHINNRELAAVYRRHPQIYVNILEETAKACIKSDTSRFLYENRRTDSGVEWVERFNLWQWIHRIFVPERAMTWLLMFLIYAAVLIIEAVFTFKNKEKRGLCIVSAACIFMSASQFLLLFAYYGFAEKNALSAYIILPFDLMLAGGIGFLTYQTGKLLSYLKLGKEEIYEEELYLTDSRNEEIMEETLRVGQVTEELVTEEEYNLKSPVNELLSYYGKNLWTDFNEKILNIPYRAGILFGILAACILGWTLFWPPGIGAYNNGDFGRMMVAMNLQYTEEDWANADELSLTKVVEKYDWVPDYDYSKIMPYHADLSQAWFSLPVKLVDHYVGLKFNTRYVAVMYAVITVLCFGVIMKVLFHRFGRKILWLSILLTILLLDLSNVGWFNSLFGEGVAFTGFMMVMASMLYIADSERHTCRFSLFIMFFSILIYCGSKAQYTVTAPFLLLFAVLLSIYHAPLRLWKKFFYYPFILFGCLWIGMASVNIYQANQDISAPDALYQSIFYGALMLTDEPEEVLKELKLDPAMAVDAGKHAFLDKSEYYCAPRTEKAEEMIYSRVTTFDMLFYYLRHPDKLWKVMDLTAKAAASPMPDFTLYVGEKTTQEHHVVNRFNMWRNVRYLFAADHFFELILMYGLELIVCTITLFSKKKSGKDKLFTGLFALMSFMGIVQFPLTIIGNGFADNTKQLFIFRLTYDLTLFLGIYLLFPVCREGFIKIKSKISVRKEKSNEA